VGAKGKKYAPAERNTAQRACLIFGFFTHFLQRNRQPDGHNRRSKQYEQYGEAILEGIRGSKNESE